MKKQQTFKDNIFQRWYRLSNPHWGYFFGEALFCVVYYVLLSVMTIFAAKTINCMYEGNWTGSFIFLGIELATIVLRNLAAYLTYKFYCLQIQHIRLNVAKKIYNKLLSCEKKDLNELSKEKIINIALNNMTYLSDFLDSISTLIGKASLVLFTLVVVFLTNVYAGGIIMLLGVVNFFVFFKFNKKLGSIMLERYEKKDDMYKTYSKIIEGKSIIKEMGATEKYNGRLVKDVKNFTAAYSRWHMYYICWNVVVYAVAALMLYFVSKGSLGIESYLIIVPYLTTVTDGLNYLFDKTSAVENMRVDVDRVNVILNMSDKELISYGELNKEAEGYNLGFIGVSKKKVAGQKYALQETSLSFKMGEVNIVKGPKENGKRVVFDLLRRYEKPDKGMIMLDNLDLYNYNEKTFKTHINYCASHPEFVKGSIKENLMLANKDIDKIEALCKELGIWSDIEKLPQKFENDIEEIKSPATKFMLGLVRALLSNCKILMIYELPDGTPDSYRQKIIKLIRKYHVDKTLIIFTHSDLYDNIASTIHEVVKGKVKKIK